MPPLESSPNKFSKLKKYWWLVLILLIIFLGLVVAFLFATKPKTTTNSSETKTATKASTVITKPAPTPPTKQVTLSDISIYQQMLSQDSQNYQNAVAAGSEFSPTADGKSFWLYWKPQIWSSAIPKKIIISLGGHDGYASQDFAAWYPILSNDYPFALASLQWWFGKGEKTSDYYTPKEMNQQIESFLIANGYDQKDLIVLQGFSRGSANSYAVAAQDSTKKYLDYIISNAGGFHSDYAPNKELLDGKFGAASFASFSWILYCGEKDPDPDASGCPGMESTKTIIEKYGASVVLFIKDPKGTHGSFMTTPTNVKQALDLILK